MRRKEIEKMLDAVYKEGERDMARRILKVCNKALPAAVKVYAIRKYCGKNK